MKSVPDRRAEFVSKTQPLADQVGDGYERLPKRSGWTSRAVWFERGQELLAVVGEQEARHTDEVLAHGLGLAGDRALRLVLPREWAFPTRFRAPWLKTEIEVWTHDGCRARLAKPLDKCETRRLAGDYEDSPAHRLSPSAAAWIRALLEWATTNEDLIEAHTGSVRAWSHNGQRVLRIEGKKKIRIKAGIDAKSDPALQLEVNGTLTDDDLGAIQRAVRRGIKDARAKKYGPFEEHHLQVKLRRNPSGLLLENPLLREVPAWRPAANGNNQSPSRGRGFIDLAGLDASGDITIVETKLDSDDMLALQGLDYWVWATNEQNHAWLRKRLWSSADAEVRLLYAIGGKGGADPKIGAREKHHFTLLDDEIPWRVALIHDWPGSCRVTVLDPRTPPT